jgi:hypothetical protein
MAIVAPHRGEATLRLCDSVANRPFLETLKLPNEPNLKTASPAIPASREGETY